MDRKDELDRSHGDDDPTRTWSTSSQFGFPDYYGYNGSDVAMLHRDAAVHPGAARDLRPRRGLPDGPHHQAAFATSMPLSYHETWPPDGGMMMQESQHMMHSKASFHPMQPHQHMQGTSIPFPSHPSTRVSVPAAPGVSTEEADRTLQALLTAAGLNGTMLPGQSPFPGRTPAFDPSQHYFHGDARQEFFPPTVQGVFQQSVHEQHSRSTDSLPFMMHPSHPLPASTANARPPSNAMWAHTYPDSAGAPGGIPPNDMGLENPFPSHTDAARSFRPAHTLPFSSPPGSPAVAQHSSPSPSVASAPTAASNHSIGNVASEVPPSCTAPDLPPLSGAMFQMRQLPDRVVKADPRATSAAVSSATGSWGPPGDAGGAALPYDCLSLPTIHEASQPRRGSHNGAASGGLAARQIAGQANSGGFGSPPPPRRMLLATHDSFRSNNSGSFRSTSSVNTSFRSGFGSFRSESFHHDGDLVGEHPRGRDVISAAAAAAAASTGAAAPAPPHPAPRQAGAVDDNLQDAPAPVSAATDMSSLARALDRAPATVAAVAEALSNTAAGFPLGLPSLTKLLCNSSKRGKHAKALAVFAAAPSLGLAPDLPLCNAALMAASSAGNADASAMIFRQMVAQGLQPDSVSYRASVTALVKYDHMKEALQVLLHMLTDGRAHDSTACMAAILSMGRHGAWPMAEQLLLAAFRPRYGLERISGMQPAALSQVPESFQDMYQQLCDLNGLQPAPPPEDEPDATLGLDAPSCDAHTMPSASEAAPIGGAGVSFESGGGGSSRALEEVAEATGVLLDETVHAADPPTGGNSASSNTYMKQRRLEHSLSVSGSAGNGSGDVDALDAALPRAGSPPPATPPSSGADVTPVDAKAAGDSQVGQMFPQSQYTSRQASPPLGAPPAQPSAPLPVPASAGGLFGRRTSAGAAPPPSARIDEPDPLARACFNALLLSYSCATPPQFERATEVLVAMIQRSGDVSPDVISFNIVLRMLCASQRLSAVPALLDLSRLARVPLLATSYAIYMAGCATVGDAQLTVSVWAEMISAQIVPAGAAVSLYLAALFQLGHYADAIAIFLKISSAPLAPVPDAASIAVLFATCLHLHCRPQQDQGGPDALSVTSLVARATAPFPEASFEAVCVIVEELGWAGCMRAMHIADATRVQASAAVSRIGVMQALFSMLASMQQSDHGGGGPQEPPVALGPGGGGYDEAGVAACAGIIVGGVVRRVADGVLDLRGAPLPAAGSSRRPVSVSATQTGDTTGAGLTTLTVSTTNEA